MAESCVLPMNCPNCGAPMQLVDGRDYFVCQYCTTFQFPEKTHATADGAIVLGDTSTWDCPVCHDGLRVASVDRQRVFFCKSCRGVLMTNTDFAEIVKRRRAAYHGPENKPIPLDPEQLSRRLRCPKCSQRMDTHPYYGPGNVVVDTCFHCLLIWLDHGEIGVIEKAPGRR